MFKITVCKIQNRKRVCDCFHRNGISKFYLLKASPHYGKAGFRSDNADSNKIGVDATNDNEVQIYF